MSDFQKYLNQFVSPKGGKFSNTSMAYPKESYNIPDDKYNEFLEKYKVELDNGADLHLTEKPSEFSPIRIDLDFSFENNDSKKRKYTHANIENFITEYCKILETYFEINECEIYLQEKPESSTFRDKIKDGVHIILPNIYLSYELQHFIRDIVIRNDNIIKEFQIMNVVNKIDDIVDKAVISSNNWFIYGSKKLESHSYKVTKIYSYTQNALKTIENDNNLNYIDLFSMRKTVSDNNVIIREDKLDTINDYKKSLVKKQQPKFNNDFDYIFSKALNLNKNMTTDDDLILTKKLVLECLSYNRAENYNDWIKLGWCLRNIDYRLLDTWIEFSKIGSSFVDGECEDIWDKMKEGSLTIGSLKYWCKLDNKIKFEELFNDSISPLVDKSIRSNGAHCDVAQVVSKYMKDKIIYDTKVKSWYIVNDKTNIWEQDKEGIKVRLILSTYCCNLYMKRSIFWNNIQMNIENEEQQIANAERAKKCLKIAAELKNSGYKDSIMKELKSWCVQDNFIEEYLDCNINLFAFKNGVYDLESNIFRQIEPIDYISTTTDYNYNQDIDKLYIDKVIDFLKSTQKNDEMYAYLLDVLSSMIYGKNYHQEFYIFNGKGANGKSVLMSLLLLTFGKYGNKINATTFTKPSKGANETSEMHSCKSSRLILVEEPEETDTLITSRLKEFSGDGKIKTRGLHENAFEFDPQFGLIFFCNQIPSLSKVDNAIGRRLRLLDFPFKFCDIPIMNNEKLIDRNLNILFKDNIEYRQAFAYILLDNWKNKNLNKNKMNTPIEVMQVTNEYMEDCNEVKKFIKDFYEITNDNDDKITSRDLYTWFKYRTGLKMDEKSFAYNMAELGISKKKTKTSNIYIGIKEKSDDNE